MRDEVVRWVRAYGNTVSTALFDPACRHFTRDGIDGAIAYKIGWGCAIAVGDPACPASDRMPLARAFRDAAREKGLVTVFAVVSESMANSLAAEGAAALAYGKDLGLDPQRDPAQGSKGRELRKKLIHARRSGLRLNEYDREQFGNAWIDGELESVARAWIEHRHGPQVFLTGVRLFEAPDVTRYFRAIDRDECVGVLTTVQLDALDGYLLNHMLVKPDAPDGTSEALVMHALETLRDEGCRFATFGPAPDRELGNVMNLSRRSEAIARKVFAVCGERFHLDARTRYRRKFQVAREEGSYLVFDPPKVGAKQLGALARAFNVSFT